jgi:hypothetical protein
LKDHAATYTPKAVIAKWIGPGDINKHRTRVSRLNSMFISLSLRGCGRFPVRGIATVLDPLVNMIGNREPFDLSAFDVFPTGERMRFTPLAPRKANPEAPTPIANIASHVVFRVSTTATVFPAVMARESFTAAIRTIVKCHAAATSRALKFNSHSYPRARGGYTIQW